MKTKLKIISRQSNGDAIGTIEEIYTYHATLLNQCSARKDHILHHIFAPSGNIKHLGMILAP